MVNSYLVVEKSKVVTYVGPDSTMLFQAIVLKSSLGMWVRTGIKPTRGVGVTRMLELCKQFTGKTYRRGQSEQALADLQQWILAMKSALPVIPASGCSEVVSETGV